LVIKQQTQRRIKFLILTLMSNMAAKKVIFRADSDFSQNFSFFSHFSTVL